MEEPRGKEYAGPSGIGRDSVWLTAEDLIEGRDVDVTIEAVMLYPEVTFMGGRKRLNLIGLKFVGKERILGLNATNRKALGKQFGNVAKGWKGQTISLYVTDTQMAGETVKCVRIRNRGSRSATAAEQFLHEDPPARGAKKAPPAPPVDLSDTDEGSASLFGEGEVSGTAVGAEEPRAEESAVAASPPTDPEASAPPPAAMPTTPVINRLGLNPQWDEVEFVKMATRAALKAAETQGGTFKEQEALVTDLVHQAREERAYVAQLEVLR